MNVNKKSIIRVSFSLILLISISIVAIDFVTAEEKDQRLAVRHAYQTNSNEQLVSPRENATFIISDRKFAGQRKSALLAYAPNGSVLYYNETYDNYQDVDPAEEGRWTVEYLAAERLPKSKCHSETDCSRMVIERLNLSTGEVTRIYSRLAFDRSRGPVKRGDMEWHDADRIDNNHYLIGDIALDRVFIVNVSNGVIVWEWEALSEYSTSGGGEHPVDWTHLNDVEYLTEGRIMVSLRNQDQVVFINQSSGLDHNWTLGADQKHSILYGQHNPDYLPHIGGGSVVVADSENDRLVEYRRTNQGWKRTWVYSDPETVWPRDADRLPNGHTLITASGSGRVFEVNEQGDIVWEVSVVLPYEAERLGTGPESQNGPSAREAGVKSVSSVAQNPDDKNGDQAPKSTSIVNTIKNLWPSFILHSILFILPSRFDMYGVNAMISFALAGLLWILIEFRWSDLELQKPITIDRK